VGLALFLVAIVGPAADARLKHPDYTGHVRGDPNSRIEIRVGRAGGERSVTFEARQIRLICDDGTRPRGDASPVTAPLRRDGSFSFSRYQADDFSQDQHLYNIEGQLHRKHARGFLAQLVDPWDPPEEGNQVECSTMGNAVWRARPTRLGPGSVRFGRQAERMKKKAVPATCRGSWWEQARPMVRA